MAYRYKVSKDIIESVMNDLIQYSFIPKDSVFCYDTENTPDKNVYYNDYALLDALGHYRSIETVEQVLVLLKEKGIVPEDSTYPLVLFEAFSYRVKNNFIVPWKSFTPTMERLVYMLSWVKKPSKSIFIGINCGYSLAWVAGAFWKSETKHDHSVVYGVDINKPLLNIANQNLKNLKLQASVQIMNQDGYAALKQYPDEYFDLVFLDTRKNFGIMELIYKKLKKGGWLLIHNASDRHFEKEMRPFLEFVRDERHFSDSILFDIDTKGLELSIKSL